MRWQRAFIVVLHPSVPSEHVHPSLVGPYAHHWNFRRVRKAGAIDVADLPYVANSERPRVGKVGIEKPEFPQ